MRAINQPVAWWGWHWERPRPMSIVEIMASGSMSPALAASLWIAMERGASLIVAADPPAAGKTTTLTALLAFTPPDTVVYFTRGLGETFELPPLTDSYPTYILVNEMSDHLPVYTWGPYARRAFELLGQGYSLASTMHANTLAEVIAQLEEDLEIPRPLIANLTFIIPLYIGYRRTVIRRVAEVAFLLGEGESLDPRPLARWNEGDDSFSLFPTQRDFEDYAHWAGLSPAELARELERREAFLRKLLESGPATIPEVNAAIETYYREVIAPSRGEQR